MTSAYCPGCDEKIKLNSPKEGQLVTCQNCGDELEVVSLTPLELDWAYDGLDDDFEWDDDDDDLYD